MALESDYAPLDAALDALTLRPEEKPTAAKPVRPTFRHIVVGYDGSEGATRALAWARDLGTIHGASVTVASVFTPPEESTLSALGQGWDPSLADRFARFHDELRDAAAAGGATLQRAGLRADARVVEGHPPRALAEVAEEEHADLVVVGARRRTRLGALLGSSASTLLERTDCSLLFARNEPRPRRILAATDGSHVSYRAVAHALRHAGATGAELEVLHVLPFPDEADDAPRQELLERVRARLRLPSAPARVAFRLDAGNPPQRILGRAAEIDAGLVVVGAHGPLPHHRRVVGSVSRRVANEAQASVLVVKEPERGEGSA